MGFIRSLSAKLSGRKMNSVIAKAAMMGDNLPLGTEVRMIDPERVSMIEMNGRGAPILGAAADGELDIRRMKGAFSDGEEFVADLKDGKFVLMKGRDRYWFQVLDPASPMPKMPPAFDTDTHFEMDPRKISRMYDKRMKDGYARLVAGYDRHGNRTVQAFLFDEGYNLLDAVDLKTEWTGKESSVRLPMKQLKGIGALGRSVNVGMKDDYPLVATIDEGEMDVRYLLAPRIHTDSSEIAREDRQQQDWIASHNRLKRKRL